MSQISSPFPADDPRTVLVVDDEPLIRLTLAEFLRDEGFRVIEAADGEFARIILEHVHVDLVISDVQMPRLGGFQLAEILRRQNPATKLILMTGYTADAIPRWIIDANVPLLVKPVELDAILGAIHSCLTVPQLNGAGGRNGASPDAATICVLDDDEAERYVAQRILQEAGYDVLSTGEAARIAPMMNARRVDLLVLDIRLPNGESGFNVGTDAHRLYPATKLLYVSAYDFPHDVQSRIPFLRKPLLSETLIPQVRSVLASS